MSWMYHSCFITALINKLISKKIVKIWNIRHSSVIFFKTKIFTYFLSKYFLVFSKIPDKIIYNSIQKLINCMDIINIMLVLCIMGLSKNLSRRKKLAIGLVLVL